MTIYHMPLYRRLRALVDSGALGRVRLVQVNFGSWRVLDFACGRGRHARLAAERGHRVLALDRDPACLVLNQVPGIEARVADLEADAWDWGSERFAVIVITRYLFRPRLDLLLGLANAWRLHVTGDPAGRGRSSDRCA